MSQAGDALADPAGVSTTAPGPAAAPAAAVKPKPPRPTTAADTGGCAKCHADLTRRPFFHAVLQRACTDCHVPSAKAGKCKAATRGWQLIKRQPDLCYDCHERLDTYPSTHTAVRQGECFACHEPHASQERGLLKVKRQRVCFLCHELDALATRNVKHAPVVEGHCVGCHDPHGTGRRFALRESGSKVCLRCHDAASPTGKGMPGPAMRVDLKRQVVHQAVAGGECQDCHEAGHSGDHAALLRRPPPDLCYGCHERQDGQKFVHGAVRTGGCIGCHSPHASDQKALLAKPAVKDVCFTCHQDDITGRVSVHQPVAEGKCLDCHGAHGAANRMLLTRGAGKQACQGCHRRMDAGRYRHAVLDRSGCTACHDPHGAGNPYLLPRPTNELCAGCHADQKDGRHVSSFMKKGHPVGGAGKRDPRRPNRPLSCASCHDPHGSDFPKLFRSGNSAMESCDGCHGEKAGQRPEPKGASPRGAPVPQPPAASPPPPVPPAAPPPGWGPPR